jgi:hypothetical protein
LDKQGNKQDSKEWVEAWEYEWVETWAFGFVAWVEA